MRIEDMTILLVEDEPDDVLLIKRAFEKARLVNPVQVVTDGEQAMAYLAGDGKYGDRSKYPVPMLVILDLKLPRQTGFEVLEWASKRPEVKRDIPIVVLTSSRETKDIGKAYDLGASSYMVKPVEQGSLVEVFKTMGLYSLILKDRPDDGG